VVSGATTMATREAGEPLIVANAGGRSVWFTWTAPSAGSTTIDTGGFAASPPTTSWSR
jgi:hypothetical protein